MAGMLRRSAAASCVALTAAACAWAAPAAGAATITVGSPFPAASPLGTMGHTSAATTVANVALGEAGANATSPVTGTIVLWRVKTLGTGQYALRVLRPGDAGRYTVQGSSPQTVIVAGDQTFPASVPIQAGDLIGVDIPSNQSMTPGVGGLAGVQAAGSEWGQQTPAILAGSPSGVFDANPGSEMLFNAVISYQDATEPPPAAPARSGRRCRKKGHGKKRHGKKHRRSASTAKKRCKKKRHSAR